MVTWVIERDVFNTEHFNKMVEYADNYHVVRVIPFIHEIEGKVPSIEGPVVCYGSIGIQKVAAQHSWKPGVFTGDFTSTDYMKIGEHFLNNKSQVFSLAHLQVRVNLGMHKEPFFCKSNDDNKAFAGQVFEPHEFNDWVNKMQDTGYLDSLDFDVVVAPVQELAMEYRVFVVGDEIADMCIYRQWQSVQPQHVWDEDVADLVMRCHNLFAPAEAYVVDVVQTREALKIVEYNTLNSAGFYACDPVKIMRAIEAHVGKSW